MILISQVHWRLIVYVLLVRRTMAIARRVLVFLPDGPIVSIHPTVFDRGRRSTKTIGLALRDPETQTMTLFKSFAHTTRHSKASLADTD
ncbi:hypothetical protein EV361DRAFT_940336 [Lentinula raphanica]|uniref:Secreted protein n=1 Tax=Lentinula raphanica TaxID=153919 RepID=A0AA38UBN8_9AGAR|nr:hypothetical protein F5878DRAFT_253807 [Lentinula raphanica]KAJ3965107.1 hypothetical protein EV361DRAFT_940336 [Lentinula raphanica]